MKAERRKQVFLAWLLLLVMLPFFVVKIAHRHELKEVTCCTASHADEGEEHSQNPDHCLICNFFLSPFLESHSLDLHFILALSPVERITFPGKKVFQLSYSPNLRAPPACC
ncbi:MULTISPECIES: hypothetical protein [Parabacteroides]|uniref:hypothetical protein n=1 Tax=Parabacteroides leei TaxID=2939491 RepID=UPI0025FB6403|nr:hypothetical protein [Parabacteroides goldsteinii]